jgi:hypothetical protein
MLIDLCWYLERAVMAFLSFVLLGIELHEDVISTVYIQISKLSLFDVSESLTNIDILSKHTTAPSEHDHWCRNMLSKHICLFIREFYWTKFIMKTEYYK